MAVEITTNNVPRDLFTWDDMSEAERKDFDYVDDDFKASDSFFRYKGNIYDTNDCEAAINTQFEKDWMGVFSETFFSGVLFRFTSDYEQVIVGRYFVSG